MAEDLASGPFARSVRLVQVRLHVLKLPREICRRLIALLLQLADHRTGHFSLPSWLRPRRDLEVSHVDALLELRVVERDLDAERSEALNALQLPELEALDRAAQIAEVLQIIDIPPILQRLGRLIVDDGHRPRLRHALARPLY